MKQTYLKDLFLQRGEKREEITLFGWVKTVRDSKNIGFIELYDGSTFKSAQVVFMAETVTNYKEVAKLGVGASIKVIGKIVLTPDAKQSFEINAQEIEILGEVASDYPLQKKRHTVEFLRTMPHLRARTNTFTAAFRVRSTAAFAIHKFFNEHGFIYVHTPLITGSDCEGAGEMFRVSTLDPKNPPLTEDGKIDYSKDFFAKQTNLTVSGQLEGEAMSAALGNIYTFGPTFRAENSNTPRHAAEFWMIEPEMSFTDLAGFMDNAEQMIKYVIESVLEKCPDEIEFFNKFFDTTLIERLGALLNSDFERLTYSKAVEILEKHNAEFQYPVSWGIDLQTEHERYLTEKIYCKPVFVTDYPKEIKSFYMRLNDDGKTVAAADMLVPSVGELVGGSQREERYENLVARIDELGLNRDDYDWYLDLRRFGSVEHSGYGLGFERLIMYLTGIPNIRDVIPFPRTAGGF